MCSVRRGKRVLPSHNKAFSKKPPILFVLWALLETREESLSVAAFQSRRAGEIVRDEGRRRDTDPQGHTIPIERERSEAHRCDPSGGQEVQQQQSTRPGGYDIFGLPAKLITRSQGAVLFSEWKHCEFGLSRSLSPPSLKRFTDGVLTSARKPSTSSHWAVEFLSN
ncbi:hypothetical protein EYF80_003503 [Liparis tanakae]|uniref:Uncharacterized protein n=1 Tax=Liparis tanakae TaxID=230148 RepID=A0A4Z2J7B1_9TELE|nr:hypothetical protein EYF80_003503 [Liparis tanakae]